MRTLKKICTLLTSFLFLFVGCDGREMPDEVPDDFAIYYADWVLENQKDILDTYEGIIQKDLVSAGIAKETYVPSDEVLTIVYNKIVELGLQNLAGDYRSKEKYIQPMSYFEIRFTADGKTYEILADVSVWHGLSDVKIDADVAEKIEEFCYFMSDTMRETEEYQSLPESVGGYQ